MYIVDDDTSLADTPVASMQASERRSLKTKMEEIKKELRLVNKAVIEVHV